MNGIVPVKLSPECDNGSFRRAKTAKLRAIKKLVKENMGYLESPDHLDFLSRELRNRYGVEDTDAVSSNQYDPMALEIIERCREGMVLDCGAGKRDCYFPNVVNYEIVPYPSTDVLGVGEILPFKDESFDAVFSLAVLEHVKDPFQCAREISRVLKKGGVLYCVVPFLQPFHGYPNHYFNMTHKGLATLFEDSLKIERQEVIASGLPVWSLSWILGSWVNGLEGETREAFLNMKVSDLIGNPIDYLDKAFVTQLSPEKNFELASTTALIARK